LTTVHANSPHDALARVESMVAMANLKMPDRAIRYQIASAIHAVLQVARLADSSRRLMNLSEVTGIEGDMIMMQEIYSFERKGLTATGEVRGAFRATGIRPKFAERLAAAGYPLRMSLFEADRSKET